MSSLDLQRARLKLRWLESRLARRTRDTDSEEAIEEAEYLVADQRLLVEAAADADGGGVAFE